METILSRPNKILITIYKISKGEKINLKFEDIVVSVFNNFPDDFHLRGYPQYPDSGDLIHKPLYNFRKEGILEANNKIFSLTDRGILISEQLLGLIKKEESNKRLSRFAENEILRIKSTEGFQIFLSGEIGKIEESDFYNYMGVTPRISKNDLIGRLRAIEAFIDELSKQKNKDSLTREIILYHKFMYEKFIKIVEHFEK